jgi:integrase
MLLTSGLRASELTQLRWGDLELLECYPARELTHQRQRTDPGDGNELTHPSVIELTHPVYAFGIKVTRG